MKTKFSNPYLDIRNEFVRLGLYEEQFNITLSSKPNNYIDFLVRSHNKVEEQPSVVNDMYMHVSGNWTLKTARKLSITTIADTELNRSYDDLILGQKLNEKAEPEKYLFGIHYACTVNADKFIAKQTEYFERQLKDNLCLSANYMGTLNTSEGLKYGYSIANENSDIVTADTLDFSPVEDMKLIDTGKIMLYYDDDNNVPFVLKRVYATPENVIDVVQKIIEAGPSFSQYMKEYKIKSIQLEALKKEVADKIQYKGGLASCAGHDMLTSNAVHRTVGYIETNVGNPTINTYASKTSNVNV